MGTRPPSRRWGALLGALATGAAALGVATAVGVAEPPAGAATGQGGTIVAVGAENEYADVIAQIGGRYVKTTAILSNPNTDPHTFESSPAVAATVRQARLVVQNGVGYDGFMTTIEKASPSSSRQVIDVQQLLGLPDSTPNPHLWYDPTTMPAVAKAIEGDLARFLPSHRAYFDQNLQVFVASLAPYDQELAKIKADFPNAPVATTEPVADYLLEAAGVDNKTPFSFQAALMNNTDPAPQDVTTQDALFNQKQVKVFVYNQQVTDSTTQNLVKLAKQNDIPIVGVYETMPTPGYHYQSWMLAEADAVYGALANGTSASTL